MNYLEQSEPSLQNSNLFASLSIQNFAARRTHRPSYILHSAHADVIIANYTFWSCAAKHYQLQL